MNEHVKEKAIIVFTARSLERIIDEGGSQSWTLNFTRAKQCEWLVCTQNRHNPDPNFSDATEPHGTAFLLGRISGLRPSKEKDCENRWRITISEYARINISDAWGHWRNPVRYTSLEELGIDFDQVEFQPMPDTVPDVSQEEDTAATTNEAMLTIAEAKKRLAITFGVDPDDIEIIIHG